MPIVFEMPVGAGIVMQLGFVAMRRVIATKIQSIVDENKIGKIKNIEANYNKLKVWLEDEKDVTILMLVWDHDFIPGASRIKIYYEPEDHGPD